MDYLKTFFFILLTIVIFKAQINHCPAACKCSINNVQHCRICLSITYKRNYSISNNTCPCLENFQETYPPVDYCVAKNCSLYYEKGCYECNKNWTLYLLDNWYICICKSNYYFDYIDNDCFCSAQLQQYTKYYYQPSKYQCLPCPQQCACDNQGCYSCLNQLNRVTERNIQNIWTCYCNSDYQQVDGLCIQKKLIITNCTPPTFQKNKKCVCVDPYYLDTNNNCVCKSLTNPTKYYQYHGFCYACPERCICSQLGCYRCFDSLMEIYQNHCTCINIQGVIYLNGRCMCINPWNLVTCGCSSFNEPSLFYTRSSSTCHICPINCTCNQNGCVKCDKSTNRNNSCYCNQPFTEIDDKCIGCGDNFIYAGDACLCPNQLSSDKIEHFYLDRDTFSCKICPTNCNCDDTGCYFCQQSLFRIRTRNSQNIYICNCNTELKFEENLNNTCQCIYPYTFNETSNLCECHQPYYINGSECICKSFLNSSEYYLYNYNDCRRCPYQCKCIEKGCISCDKNQGRMILRSNNTYICPCIPIILDQTSGSCTSCFSNQYLWRNKCLDCDLSCATCDQNGCLSCSQNLILQGTRCLCTNNDTLNHIYNSNGTCTCITGYFNGIYEMCDLCPLNCKDCYFLQQTENLILCSECNINVFRINDPYNNCPCLENYVQNIILSSYCCHYTCGACNISGCTQCLPFTYRYMNTTDPNYFICSCIDGFIQNNSSICTCPLKSYLYKDKCLPCPNYCSSCLMIKGINVIDCICLNGINRVNKQHSISHDFVYYQFQDCICDDNFIQAQNQPYCYSKYCSQYGINGTCRACIKFRTLSSDKLYCNCSIGYYQNADKVCKLCNQGCAQCLSYYVCLVCQSDYELILDKQNIQAYCIIPSDELNLLYQSDNYTILQIKSKQLQNFRSINMFINLINSTSGNQPFRIVQIRTQIIEDTIIIKFDRFSISESIPYIIQIHVKKYDISDFYLQNDPVYTKQQLSYSNTKQVFIYFFISLLMLISLILNIIGIKQNDIMSYCQTIYFFAMKVNDPSMLVVPFLSYFKITIFNFSFESSNSPFDGVLSNWQKYIEYSTGNYKYYNIDSNLLRNAGLALYLALQNAFLIIVFRFIYHVLYNMKDKKYRNLAQKYKKPIYRFFEWCYKLFMYPVLYYSLSTLICYRTNYSLINQSFKQLNMIIAIVMIILYIIITIIQYLYNQISKMHKNDSLIEFCFEIIISIVIVSIPSTLLLFVVLLVFIKGCLQLYNYQILAFKKLRVYQKVISMSIILIQSLIFFPIYFSSIVGTVIVLLISLLSVNVYRIYLYNRIQAKYKYSKRNQNKQKKEIIQYVESFQNIRVNNNNPRQICVLE